MHPPAQLAPPVAQRRDNVSHIDPPAHLVIQQGLHDMNNDLIAIIKLNGFLWFITIYSFFNYDSKFQTILLQ